MHVGKAFPSPFFFSLHPAFVSSKLKSKSNTHPNTGGGGGDDGHTDYHCSKYITQH